MSFQVFFYGLQPFQHCLLSGGDFVNGRPFAGQILHFFQQTIGQFMVFHHEAHRISEWTERMSFGRKTRGNSCFELLDERKENHFFLLQMVFVFALELTKESFHFDELA